MHKKPLSLLDLKYIFSENKKKVFIYLFILKVFQLFPFISSLLLKKNNTIKK